MQKRAGEHETTGREVQMGKGDVCVCKGGEGDKRKMEKEKCSCWWTVTGGNQGS